MTDIATDILILGTGGAGLMAALHAHWRDPSQNLLLVSKGMLGKSGCTRTIARGRIRCCAIGRGVRRCRICEVHLKFMRHFDVSRAGLSGQGAGA